MKKLFEIQSPFAEYGIALFERDHDITPYVVTPVKRGTEERVVDGFLAYQSETMDKEIAGNILSNASGLVNNAITVKQMGNQVPKQAKSAFYSFFS